MFCILKYCSPFQLRVQIEHRLSSVIPEQLPLPFKRSGGYCWPGTLGQAPGGPRTASRRRLSLKKQSPRCSMQGGQTSGVKDFLFSVCQYKPASAINSGRSVFLYVSIDTMPQEDNVNYLPVPLPSSRGGHPSVFQIIAIMYMCRANVTASFLYV